MRAGSPLPGMRTLPYLPDVEALQIKGWDAAPIVDPGFRVQVLWGWIKFLLFLFQGLGSRDQGQTFRAWRPGFRVQGFGFGIGYFRVQGSGVGIGRRVLGLG